MRNEKMYGNRRENLIRANLRENGFQAETLLHRCKSYDPGSTFLGLKIKTKKIAKTAVIAISSRITLLISTVDANDFGTTAEASNNGLQSREYPDDTGILLSGEGSLVSHGT
jgi:hypothetical protein